MQSVSEQQLDELIENLGYYLVRWSNYPLAFVIECCNAEKYGYPCLWQVKALAIIEKDRKLAIRSGHGPGKSRFLAWVFWWFMITKKRPGTPLKIPCTGPSGANLADVLWAEIKIVYSHLPAYFQSCFRITADHVYYSKNADAWFGALRTAGKDNPDALQGFHGDPLLFIIDEAFGVFEEIFEVAGGALSGRSSYAIMTGNPTKLSGFMFNKFKKKSKIWKTMHVDCRDELNNVEREYDFILPTGKIQRLSVRGRVSPDYIDEMTENYGEESPQFYIRVRGDFPTQEKEQLIRGAWVDRCWNGEKKNAEGRKRIMGVDPADMGEDPAAFVVRHGLNIEDVREIVCHEVPTDEIVDAVIARFNEFKQAGRPIDLIAVEANGVGAGVYSNLKKKGYPTQRIMVNESPYEDGGAKCTRLRDWLWWRTRLFFQDHRPWFAEDGKEFKQLAHECTVPKYKDDGKIKVETKKEIRKRTKSSPNLADALVMTMIADAKHLRRAEHRTTTGHRAQRRLKRQRQPGNWRTI